jgi:thiamine biosynthesis lipoprotein
MSTYIPDSEISRFNFMDEVGKKFYISNDFLHVAQVAEKIYGITNGAWDATVMPLVELWGFAGSDSGFYEMRTDIPDEKKIRKILTGMGFEKIEVSEQGYLKKQNASISIDFASIAKGYAVDQVAYIIRKKGVDDFLVEIGGEIYASGCRLDGRNWRVGVNVPRKDSPKGMVYEVVDITNKAMATSGDYRNFFEVNGKYYSHIIDPRTGYPVSNGVVSVSITADTCVFADGLATGVMVMGPSKGIELINTLEGVECLLVVKEDDKLKNYYSKGFRAYKP